jgi:hypothetical protein
MKQYLKLLALYSGWGGVNAVVQLVEALCGFDSR